MDRVWAGGMLERFPFGFGTLFAIINPYGLSFVFLNRTMGLSEPERRVVARRVALFAFCVLVASLFAGAEILRLFGISLPALRVGGGLVVAASGWAMLHEPAQGDGRAAASGGMAAAEKMAFFPLTMPLTTGPGTIAAAIALGADRTTAVGGFALSSLVSLLVAAAVALAILHAESLHQHAWTGRAGLMMKVRFALAAAAMAGTATMVSACTYRWHRPSAALRSTERVAVAEDTPFVAVVDSVEQRTREVALRGQNGERVVVAAGPEVRNLAQLRRGDRVVVAYGETLAVAMALPGAGGPPPLEVAEGAVRAPRGERPGAAAGRQVRARVRIEAVDRGTGRVAFVGPRSVRRIVTPREPEMVDFARGLRPGDEVDVTYIEAAAVRVEPADR